MWQCSLRARNPKIPTESASFCRIVSLLHFPFRNPSDLSANYDNLEEDPDWKAILLNRWEDLPEWRRTQINAFNRIPDDDQDGDNIDDMDSDDETLRLGSQARGGGE